MKWVGGWRGITPILAFPRRGGRDFDLFKWVGEFHPRPSLPPSRGKGFSPTLVSLSRGKGLLPTLVSPSRGKGVLDASDSPGDGLGEMLHGSYAVVHVGGSEVEG